MQMWKLRLELDDRPGRLAALTRALAEHGCNVLDLDVHAEAGVVTDELFVASPVPVDAGLLDLALAGVEVRASHISPGDAHRLVDRVTAWLDEATALLACGDAGAADLADVARRLLGAELTWIGTPFPQADGVAARAVREGEPVQAREPVKRLPTTDGSFPWVLAVPVELGGTPLVLTLARRGPRFTFTETARVRALARALASGTTHRGPQFDLADGGAVEVGSLGPSDHSALVRMHRRCSTRTQHLRYFSPLGELPEHLATRLSRSPGPDQHGVAARLGSEIVGMAHWHRDGHDPKRAEIAFLVEDGHQRRGIGTALVRELARSARRHGVHTLRAVTLSDNRAVGPLLRRAGAHATATFDGELAYEVEVERLVPPVPNTSCSSSGIGASSCS